MNSQLLKNKIGAYLEDTSVLTNEEVTELLVDCFSYFEEQEKKKTEFRNIYDGIMSNAKRQREEASALLQGIGDLSVAINKMTKGVANEEKVSKE